MKIYNQRHQQALNLKDKMEKSEKEHLNHINNFEKSQSKAKTPQDKKRMNDAFWRMEKKYEAKENELYTKFYNHMHKDFDVKNSKIQFTNKKYKDGFVDKKYINDMYRNKVRNAKKAGAKK